MRRRGLLVMVLAPVLLGGCSPGGPPAPGPAACTWHAQRAAPGTSDDLVGVSFPDTAHGWVVGGIDRPVIETTTDGGTTWHAQHAAGSNGLAAVSFVDDRHGWAVGVHGLVLATSDGGAHWQPEDAHVAYDHDVAGVAFLDRRRGWVVGDAGDIRVTSDGGRTWSAQDSQTTQHLGQVGFTDPRNGWIVAGGDSVLQTHDGGTKWRRTYTGDAAKSEVVASAMFLDAMHGWEAGSRDDGSANHGVVSDTSDGGRTWKRSVATNYDDIRFVPIAFTDLRHGWVGTYQGDLLYTDNGGRSWGERPDPAKGEQVYGMTFRDARHGWAVGASGTIMACTA